VSSGVGGVAQLGEHLLCKQGVIGSIPIVSTIMVCLPWFACGDDGFIVPSGEHVSKLGDQVACAVGCDGVASGWFVSRLFEFGVILGLGIMSRTFGYAV
jgi:hypothetical protein